MNKGNTMKKKWRLGTKPIISYFNSCKNGIPAFKPRNKEYYGIAEYLKDKYCLSSWVEKI